LYKDNQENKGFIINKELNCLIIFLTIDFLYCIKIIKRIKDL